MIEKRNFSYRICTNIQLPAWCGGIEGRAVFVGTNKNFAVHRLTGTKKKQLTYVKRHTNRGCFTEIAEVCFKKYCGVCEKYGRKGGFSVEKILENIEYVNVNGVVELLATVKYLESWFERNKNVNKS